VLGLHDEADARFGELLTKARSRAAIRELYQLRMALIHSQGRPVEAIKPALEGLALFGIQLPEGPAVKEAVAREMEKLQTLLAGKRLPELARLPEMTDPDERERLLLLSHTVLYAGYQHPELFLLLALLVMNRTLEHGLAPGCGGGFVSYALALSGLGDFERAHEFGRLGMELSERFDSVGDRALSRHIFATFANPWRQPIRSSLPLLDLAYDGFRESGVMFYCALASLQHTTHALLCGVGVQETLSRNQIYIDFLRRMELTGGLLMQGGLHLVLHKLLRGMDAEGDNAWEKEGVLEELAVVLPAAMAVNLCLLAKAAVVMGDVPRALAYAARGEQFVAYCFGHVAQVELRLCQGLLAALQHDTADAASRAQHLATLESSLEKLEGWAKHGPANCRHKALLLAAERARLLGQEREAMEAYDASIAAAAENEFVNDEALASEHAARFYLSLGRQRIARLYLQQARHAYRRWGATAKVEALSRSHPELQLAEQQGGASRAAALDVTTVLRASQAISGEIVLDELLRKLMSTMLENAGAERGLLLLQGEARLLVEARVEEGPSGGMRLRMAPDEQAALATSVVRYVERTRERVVLDDAASAGPFQSDEYIARRRPKSVLCIPVLKQKNLVGVLYLENNLVTNAFTPERCEMLELLSAQAAISLENARLYETLDQRVKDKTQELVRRNEELSQTLQQLKAAQAQLVVQEKLASLGALTAGIAHELKNPLNFVNNFALLSAELSNELEEELDGQKARLEPQGFASIEGVLSDLKRNVLKINEHGRRANNIIQAMLSHSSVASGGQREVNLNDVVKEYAALAHQGLRSRQAHAPVGLELLCDPAVQPVNLSPQDLGRVILNLVNNACYAVHAKRAALGPEFTPTVRLTTRELGNQVEVRVWDNGTGIPAGIRDKIFHPFFTTKAGEGTGLGLSISHDIVVQGNGGTLAVESEEGQFSEFIITLPRRAVKSSEA